MSIAAMGRLVPIFNLTIRATRMRSSSISLKKQELNIGKLGLNIYRRIAGKIVEVNLIYDK